MENQNQHHTRQALRRALYRILRPLVRLLLRNGLAYSEFAELTRRAYVDAALSDFADHKGKVTDSRAAVLTGLTRKEVRKQRIQLSDNPLTVEREGLSRAERVVSGWVRDKDFRHHDGLESTIPLAGEFSFESLVKRYSGDMPVRAVLDELVNAGVVAKGDDQITLLQPAYIPRGDDSGLIRLFGQEVSDLIETIDHNLVSAGKASPTRLQLSTSYDQVPIEELDTWRELVNRESIALLERLNQWLATRDGDSLGNKRPETPVRLGLSVFSIEDLPQNGLRQ